MAQPILDLRTLEPERPLVRIDGELYELAVMTDFGLVHQARLRKLMADTADLQGKLLAEEEASKPAMAAIVEELNALPAGDSRRGELEQRLFILGGVEEQDARRTKQLLDEIVDLILRAPGDVKARLAQPDQERLIQAFTTTVPMAATAPRGKEKPRKRRSTSGSSSPASAPSMASGRG